jgi:hypothetical protein
MRLYLFYLACAICLSASVSFAAPRCERVLLQSDSVIRLGTNGQTAGEITVRVQTPSLGEVACPNIPQNLERLVKRHINDLSQNVVLNSDRLIGFIASPWRSLSNSAGRSLTKRIIDGQVALTSGHVTRLIGLVVTNQVEPTRAQMIVRILSKLPGASAVPALTSILKQGSGLAVQRAAARALGRFPSKDAHAALKKCVGSVDRMLSARCERSLIRWATQETPTSNLSRPDRTQP